MSTTATVKLTVTERSTIGRAARRHIKAQGYRDITDPSVLDSASAFIAAEIDELGRFDAVEYAEISDYAWALARFLFPKAAQY